MHIWKGLDRYKMEISSRMDDWNDHIIGKFDTCPKDLITFGGDTDHKCFSQDDDDNRVYYVNNEDAGILSRWGSFREFIENYESKFLETDFIVFDNEESIKRHLLGFTKFGYLIDQNDYSSISIDKSYNKVNQSLFGDTDGKISFFKLAIKHESFHLLIVELIDNNLRRYLREEWSEEVLFRTSQYSKREQKSENFFEFWAAVVLIDIDGSYIQKYIQIITSYPYKDDIIFDLNEEEIANFIFKRWGYIDEFLYYLACRSLVFDSYDFESLLDTSLSELAENEEVKNRFFQAILKILINNKELLVENLDTVIDDKLIPILEALTVEVEDIEFESDKLTEIIQNSNINSLPKINEVWTVDDF